MRASTLFIEIIVAEIALVRGLIDRDVFSILVFMALFTTATVPIFLTIGVRWLRRRGELVRAGDRTQALLVGAGVIARRLASTLQDAMPVTLVDPNRANLVAGEREGLTVHPGNALDDVTLDEAGIDKAMRVIAATPNAEVNILAAQLAVSSGVPEVSVLLRDSDARTFRSQLSDTGITVIRAPEDIAGWEHALSSGRAVQELIEIDDESRTLEGVHDLFEESHASRFPLAVLSNGERFPYTSKLDLSAGDQLLVLMRSDSPEEISDADLGSGDRSWPAAYQPR
jgi:voltage-gated potassium channel Kch